MEDFQQQQAQFPPGSYESIAQTGRDNLSQWVTLLDHEKILKILEHQLKNEKPMTDEEDNVKWVSGGRPLVNDKGINHLLSQLRTYVSAVITLSNYKESEILDRSKELAFDLTFLLMEKYEDFEIDEGDMTFIKNLCVNCVESAYRKALNGNLSRIFSQTQATREVIGDSKDTKFGKFLGRLG